MAKPIAATDSATAMTLLKQDEAGPPVIDQKATDLQRRILELAAEAADIKQSGGSRQLTAEESAALLVKEPTEKAVELQTLLANMSEQFSYLKRMSDARFAAHKDQVVNMINHWCGGSRCC